MNSDFDNWFEEWVNKTCLEQSFGKWSIGAIAQKDLLTLKYKSAMQFAWNAAKQQNP
jgi:hypothetical protein